MRKGICPECGELKYLTRHSEKGGHRPPFKRICRKCHDKKHGIKQKPKINKKYQPGTPKYKIKNK